MLADNCTPLCAATAMPVAASQRDKCALEKKRTLFDLLRDIAIGVLLSVSALLKIKSSDSSFDSDIRFYLIAFELFMAMWLLSGKLRRWAAGTTFITFIAFAGFTTRQVVLGEDSCGCFGDARTPPLLTLLLDCTIAGVLVRPVLMAFRPWWISVSVAAVLAFSSGLAFGSHRWSTTPSTDIDGKLIGRRLPGNIVVPRQQNAVAIHTLLFVDLDCSHCRDAISILRRSVGAIYRDPIQVVVVNPALRRDIEELREQDQVNHYDVAPARLPPLTGNWPVMVEMSEGVVIQVLEGNDVNDALTKRKDSRQ